MSSQSLMIRTLHLPDQYVLAIALRQLSLQEREDVAVKLQESMLGLVGDQLAEFSGSVARAEDLARAQMRVLKLINLGLEYAATVDHEGAKNVARAKAILKQKPIETIYQVGKTLFGKDQAASLGLLKQVEVAAGGLWFRLVSRAEYMVLQTITHLDLATGLYTDHVQALAAAIAIERKLRLVPWLPITPETMMRYPHWGSTAAAHGPLSEGLIDCFLLSLLVGCFFRQESDFFDRSAGEMRTARQLHTDHAREALAVGQTEAFEMSVRHLQDIRRHEECERRAYLEDPRVRTTTFVNFLAVSIDELRQFTDLVYFEPQQFLERFKDAQKRLIQYLILMVPAGYQDDGEIIASVAQEVLSQVVGRVRQGVSDFYATLKSPEPTDNEVMAFWDSRVCLEQRWLARESVKITRAIVLGEQTPLSAEPAKVLHLPLPAMVAAVAHFLQWPMRDRETFCKQLNPNVLLKSSGGAFHVAGLFKGLSGGDSIGWSDQILPSMPIAPGNETKWVTVVTNNLAWAHLHPDDVAQLWRYGSDHVRQIIHDHLGDIKLSVSIVQQYLLFDHVDMRLLNGALQRLENEDRLTRKHRQAWKVLQEQASCARAQQAQKVIEEHRVRVMSIASQ